MILTIEKLLEGDAKIVTYYTNAIKLWKDILKDNEYINVDKLAETLFHKQMQFETECGGRWLGQEIMVTVGVGQFYSFRDGFGTNLEKAKLVKEAFSRSYCSLEVKYYAKEVAGAYDLEEV